MPPLYDGDGGGGRQHLIGDDGIDVRTHKPFVMSATAGMRAAVYSSGGRI